MKEIKLRAWIPERNLMARVTAIDWDGVVIRKGEPSFMIEEDDSCYAISDYQILPWIGINTKCKPATESGKPIFVGDILKRENQDIIGEVRWNGIHPHIKIIKSDSMYFKVGSVIRGWSFWQVIGNKYQYPAL